MHENEYDQISIYIIPGYVESFTLLCLSIIHIVLFNDPAIYGILYMSDQLCMS